MVRWRRGASPDGDSLPASARHDGGRVPSAVLAGLVARAKNGDGEAFGQLYDRYVEEVYAFVAARLHDREATEDMTQTIFVRALQSLPSCRDNAAFAGWLFAIARNVITDSYRAGRFRPELLDETMDAEDLAQTPEELAIQRDEARTLRKAREHCLSSGERDLFDLLLTDLNDKEIAQVLGRSHAAIRTAHHRLMTKLRDCLRRMASAAGVRDVTA